MRSTTMPLRLNAGRFLVAALIAIAISACGKSAEDKETEAREAAYKEKYAKAKALFAERCKTAGVIVNRTVKDVEGIELIKVRPTLAWGDKRYFDPMFAGAAMADEVSGDGFIASFLYSELRNPNSPGRRGMIQPPHVAPGLNQESSRPGYRFVDTSDPVTGELWRYRIVPGMTSDALRARGGWGKDLEHQVQRGTRTRYAVDYEDIVDPADRAYWIAGTRIKAFDQSNGEVLAQLTRYVWDPGFGVSTTGRWPWQHANSRVNQKCPDSLGDRDYTTRYFVDAVLIPKQRD